MNTLLRPMEPIHEFLQGYFSVFISQSPWIIIYANNATGYKSTSKNKNNHICAADHFFDVALKFRAPTYLVALSMSKTKSLWHNQYRTSHDFSSVYTYGESLYFNIYWVSNLLYSPVTTLDIHPLLKMLNT